jgi:DNA-binding CsgD family transcriptional regulator
MNQIDAQCNTCQHTWHWASGTPLRCPHCQHFAYIEHQARNGPLQHTEKCPKNQTRARQIAGKGETQRQDTRQIHVFPDERLTDRELDVLRLVAQGQSNKKVAVQLVISLRTVENHLHTIYDKICVCSRTEAAVWAMRRGLVDSKKGGSTYR